jgi:hypothetical protein
MPSIVWLAYYRNAARKRSQENRDEKNERRRKTSHVAQSPSAGETCRTQPRATGLHGFFVSFGYWEVDRGQGIDYLLFTIYDLHLRRVAGTMMNRRL